LAMSKRGVSLRQRARVPQDIEQQFRIVCLVPEQGSYMQPIRFNDPGESLFSTDDISGISNSFDNVLEAAASGNEDGLRQEVPDERWRTQIIDAIIKMLPRPGTEYSLSIDGGTLGHEIDLSEARPRIMAMRLQKDAEAVSRSVIGRVEAIDFGERKLRLIHPVTKRAFDCFYSEIAEAEAMLLENARELVQVFGDVEVDGRGEVIKVVETLEIRPVDLRPIPVSSFIVDNVRVVHRGTLYLKPELDEGQHLLILRDDSVGIDLFAESREELEATLQHELRLLWRDYAHAPDDTLTMDAQELKAKLLSSFSESPHVA
jgi:hypothetical protein